MSTKKLQILGGMNANTLGGKTADEFAAASDFEQLKTLVGDKSVSDQIDEAMTDIDNMELITVDDIHAICGTTIQHASMDEVTF